MLLPTQQLLQNEETNVDKNNLFTLFSLIDTASMKRLIIALLLLGFMAGGGFAARGGGGRGRGRKIISAQKFIFQKLHVLGKQRGRLFGSRMPVIIQHRNPASMNYYDNKDVSIYCSKKLQKETTGSVLRVLKL